MPVAAVLVMSGVALAGAARVALRNDREAVVLRGDEAVAVANAVEPATKHLRKTNPKVNLVDYVVHVERRAPSAWIVTFGLNDIDARGGGVEVALDATGTKVVSVVGVE